MSSTHPFGTRPLSSCSAFHSSKRGFTTCSTCHVFLYFIKFSFPVDDLQQQRGHVRLLAEVRHGREQRFEVEDDACRQREAAERLPIDAEVDSWESQFGSLEVAVFLMRITRRHIEGLVDSKPPGSRVVWA